MVGSKTSDMFIAYSTDRGASWTQASNPSSSPNNCNGVVYGGSVFLAACKDHIFESSNGIDWTEVYTQTDGNFESIAYGNEVFVAVTGNGYVFKYTSSWSKIYNSGNSFGSFFSVAYANDKFIAVGHSVDGRDGLVIIFNADASSWSVPSAGINIKGQDVIYGNGIIVVVKHNENIWYSSDGGSTWNSQSNTLHIDRITYNNKFIGEGTDNDGPFVATSEDGVTWTKGATIGDGSSLTILDIFSGCGLSLIHI